MRGEMIRLYREGGYTILAVLILSAIVGIVLTASSERIQGYSQMIYEQKEAESKFYEVEKTHEILVSTMRKYAYLVASPFTRERFYSDFDRVTSSVGANDIADFNIPSQLRVNGTSNTPIVVSDASLGTAAFPTTYSLLDGSATDITALMPLLNWGDAKIRFTLLDAIPEDPSKDYGDSPNPAPETDFDPIYRFDAIHDLNTGAHMYSIVQGDTINLFDVGIFGKNTFTFDGTCDSYDSSASDYSTGVKQANCYAMSGVTTGTSLTGTIYGTLKANESGLSTTGKVCADFTSGCPNAGSTCIGVNCSADMLDQFQSWSSYCPSPGSSIVVNSAQTLTASSSQDCWTSVTITGRGNLTLLTDKPVGGYSYYFSTLDLQASNAKITIAPTNNDNLVELWVNSLTVTTIYDTNFVNNNGPGWGRPRQFHLYYLGSSPITLTGTSRAFNMTLIAPNAKVTVDPNVEIKGAVIAKELVVNSGASIHYDESLVGEGMVEDIQYKVIQKVLVYR